MICSSLSSQFIQDITQLCSGDNDEEIVNYLQETGCKLLYITQILKVEVNIKLFGGRSKFCTFSTAPPPDHLVKKKLQVLEKKTLP